MSDATSPERLLLIFEMFEKERRPTSLKEIAEYCKMPVSTCHNLVHILIKHSYMYQTGQRKELYPTRKLYDVAKGIVEGDTLVRRMLPVLESLCEQTRETVILGKRQKGQIVYLEVLESPEVIRYSARAGDVKPLHSSSIGKAVLSTLAADDMRQLLAEFPQRQVTDKTITDFDRLAADLDQGRSQGYFATHGENVADVTALAAAIPTTDDAYGIAVAGPSHRMDAHFERIARALQEARTTLEEQGVALRRT